MWAIFIAYFFAEDIHNNDKIYLDNPFGDLKSYGPLDNRLMNSGSLIAVSYEARARGVKRSMRGGEAKKV